MQTIQKLVAVTLLLFSASGLAAEKKAYSYYANSSVDADGRNVYVYRLSDIVAFASQTKTSDGREEGRTKEGYPTLTQVRKPTFMPSITVIGPDLIANQIVYTNGERERVLADLRSHISRSAESQELIQLYQDSSVFDAYESQTYSFVFLTRNEKRLSPKGSDKERTLRGLVVDPASVPSLETEIKEGSPQERYTVFMWVDGVKYSIGFELRENVENYIRAFTAALGAIPRGDRAEIGTYQYHFPEGPSEWLLGFVRRYSGK